MLTPQQAKLIRHLAAGGTIAAACGKAKVSDRSYRNWVLEPEFAGALQAAYRETFQASINQIKGLTAPARAALRRLIRSKREAIQLRAVRLVFDLAIRGGEIDDVLRRLAALEGNG